MIALLQNAVVTLTAVIDPAVSLASKSSVLVFVISISSSLSNPHFSGKDETSSTVSGGGVITHSFGIDASRRANLSATSVFQSTICIW